MKNKCRQHRQGPRMRREVLVRDLVTYAVISPIVIILTWLLVPLLIIPKISAPLTTVAYVVAGVITYFFTKRLIIGLVLCYKAFASLEMRESCRFTPTCSTYMIMAINKYGLLIGLIKGIRRILRCKPPNGGVDYP